MAKSKSSTSAVGLLGRIDNFLTEFDNVVDRESGEPLAGEEGKALLTAFFARAPQDYISFLKKYGALRIFAHLTSGAELPLLAVFGSANAESPLAAPAAAVAYSEQHSPEETLFPMIRVGSNWILRKADGHLMRHADSEEGGFFEDIVPQASAQGLTPYGGSFSQFLEACLEKLSTKLRNPNVTHWFVRAEDWEN